MLDIIAMSHKLHKRVCNWKATPLGAESNYSAVLVQLEITSIKIFKQVLTVDNIDWKEINSCKATNGDFNART